MLSDPLFTFNEPNQDPISHTIKTCSDLAYVYWSQGCVSTRYSGVQSQPIPEEWAEPHS